MSFPDPAAVLCRLLAFVKPGGIVAFQELDLMPSPPPQMLPMQRVERGPDSHIYDWVAQATRAVLPLIQQVGVATADEVQVDTLAERMRREVVEKD
ncbi:MAG: hypothetical protein KatS3mg057_1560 [Herpetosiphonaceae bacterium]|nr:MAG: hypothetical protein KatS3mg057_1560 [Herpetosiphonaceae bacterium]